MLKKQLQPSKRNLSRTFFVYTKTIRSILLPKKNKSDHVQLFGLRATFCNGPARPTKQRLNEKTVCAPQTYSKMTHQIFITNPKKSTHQISNSSTRAQNTSSVLSNRRSKVAHTTLNLYLMTFPPRGRVIVNRDTHERAVFSSYRWPVSSGQEFQFPFISLNPPRFIRLKCVCVCVFRFGGFWGGSGIDRARIRCRLLI